MQKKIKILFVGTFLASQKGTQPIAEHIRQHLSGTFSIRLVSSQKNKFLRILDIILNILLHRPSCIVIDVFSGQALWIARIAAGLSRTLPRNTRIILNLRGGKLAEYYIAHTAEIHALFSKADSIITPSKFLQSEFTRLGYKVQVVPNFVNLHQFEYIRDQVKPKTLLWVRAFNTTYNPHIAIEVLAALHQRGYPYILTMVGPDDGLLNTSLELAAKLNVIDSIRIIGPVPQSKLPEYYQTHGIYLNTTSYESFGNALLEAASCGIPIVSNSVGEIPYMWEHNKDCILVNNNDIHQFTEAVLKLESQPEFARTLSKQARVKAVTYTWEHVSNRWLSLLHHE